MKNTKYFPFERNKYFFGKLLSVSDFEVEQKYFNDKRRLINRLLHGAGVVCGLNVIKVDDSFISIESGLALDSLGREVLIDSPVIKKLSMFDGFSQDTSDSRYVYLCIKYDEEEKEPIHSITNAINNYNGGIQYNKYREGYKLYLDYNDPEIQPSEAENIFNSTVTIYQEDGICIKHILPKYIKENDEFDFTILIEKNNLSTPISLSYNVFLQCVEHNAKNQLLVEFDEKKVTKKEIYKINYRLKAKQVKLVDGVCSVVPETFKLKIGSREITLDAAKISCVNIVEENVNDKILSSYFNTNMDDIINSRVDEKIYLAKISLVKAGNTYIIDKVENNPFNQYVLNSVIMQAFENIQKEEIKKLKGNYKKELNVISNESSILREESLESTTGIIKININQNAKVGSVVFSEEIMHGLGLGNVYAVLGIESEDKKEIIFGDTSIFENDKKFALASKVNTEKGTMIIGIKLLEKCQCSWINVRWMAYRDVKEKIKEIEEISLHIKPDVNDIKVRETIYLETIASGLQDSKCIWSIKEKEGGSIDENGKYVAPSTPGIYEIVAKNIINPDVEASTFVVVRAEEE